MLAFTRRARLLPYLLAFTRCAGFYTICLLLHAVLAFTVFACFYTPCSPSPFTVFACFHTLCLLLHDLLAFTRRARRDRICLLLHAVLAFYRICLLSHAVLAFTHCACFYTICLLLHAVVAFTGFTGFYTLCLPLLDLLAFTRRVCFHSQESHTSSRAIWRGARLAGPEKPCFFNNGRFLLKVEKAAKFCKNLNEGPKSNSCTGVDFQQILVHFTTASQDRRDCKSHHQNDRRGREKSRGFAPAY